VARSADLVVVFESHATSRDNEDGLASGWFDVALSATGEEQARLLGARVVTMISQQCSVQI